MVTTDRASNHVLSLDEDGDYVEVSHHQYLDVHQMTLELWVLPRTLVQTNGAGLITKGTGEGGEVYCLDISGGGKYRAYVWQGGRATNVVSSLPMALTWTHLSCTFDGKRLTLYVNGQEVASAPVSSSQLETNTHALSIGSRQSGERDYDLGFDGFLDEVRVWSVARTPEQIRGAMFQRLTGVEPGLVGYWHFDGDGETAVDATGNGLDGQFMGSAHRAEAMLPRPDGLTITMVLSGVVTDVSSSPLANASVSLEQHGQRIMQTTTNERGSYWFALQQPSGLYDLTATQGSLGTWELDLRLSTRKPEALNPTVDLTLEPAISISGTVLSGDNATPQVRLPVHAIRQPTHQNLTEKHPKCVVLTLTDEAGQYQFINLRPGSYQVDCSIPGSDVYYDGKQTNSPVLQVEPGKAIRNVDFRVVALGVTAQKVEELVPASPRTMRPLKPLLEASTYTAKVGADAFRSAFVDAQGYTWFTTVDVSTPYFYRFDGKQFTRIEGTIGSHPHGVRDARGKVWMAGDNGIVCLWNGTVAKQYTTEDGLPSNQVLELQADTDGDIWVMSPGYISHIQDANRNEKVSHVIETKRSVGFELDVVGGIWWWDSWPSTNSSTLYHLMRTPQGYTAAVNLRLPFQISVAHAVGEGVLLKGENTPFVYCRADGLGQILDSRLERYFGTDAQGRHYFATQAQEGWMHIIRDGMDSRGNFGYPTSPHRLEFPQKLSAYYGYLR